MPIRSIILFILITPLVLSGCEGNSSRSTLVPTNLNTVFDISGLKYYQINNGFSFIINGADSDGDDVRLTADVTNNGLVDYNGIPAVEMRTLSTLAFPNIGGITNSVIYAYFDPLGDLLEIYDADINVTGIPTVYHEMPNLALIDDTDVSYITDNSDGSSTTNVWRLEQGYNGKAFLVFITTERDISGDVISSDTLIFEIDQYGTIFSIEYERIEPPSGYVARLFS